MIVCLSVFLDTQLMFLSVTTISFAFLFACCVYCLSTCISRNVYIYFYFFFSVRTGLQRFKPLDPNALVPGRNLAESVSLSSLSLGGVPRQKFLLVTVMDKEVRKMIG